jgi:hypothetical protein
MAIHIRRREFVLTLGRARSQRAERVRRIGVLMSFSADNPEASGRAAAFMQGLGQLGWTVG